VESWRYVIGEDLARRRDWKFGIRRGRRAVRHGQSDIVENQFTQSGSRGNSQLETLEFGERRVLEAVMGGGLKISHVLPPKLGVRVAKL
jgi:hypothetical protein